MQKLRPSKGVRKCLRPLSTLAVEKIFCYGILSIGYSAWLTAGAEISMKREKECFLPGSLATWTSFLEKQLFLVDVGGLTTESHFYCCNNSYSPGCKAAILGFVQIELGYCWGHSFLGPLLLNWGDRLG